MGSNAVVRRPHFAFMATQKKKQDTFSPVDSIEMLGELEKVVKIQSIVLGKEGSLSTGNLCLDLITGGIKPGWYTFAGAEQSAKTTSAITAMGAAISQKVPLTVLWDAENSTGSSMDYVESIFKTSGLNVTSEELFGVRKDGKYVVKPLVYYRDEGEMETFFGWVSGLLRRLPDKRFEDGRWWYIYEGTRENKAKYKDVMDRHLSAGTNGVYIPAEDGSLQAYILCDSYPSLLPASLDEDDAKSGMALQAREFSKHIPKVKGKLRAKRVAIVGINQLRKAPGVMYGCFTGSSQVMMADGSTKTIREIVDNKLTGPVMSVSKTGEVSAQKITNWYNNGKTSDWLFLRVGGTARLDGKWDGRSNAEIRCTPGHRIRMANGSFKKASDLLVGDQVSALSARSMNEAQTQVILGSAMGDGSVSDKTFFRHLRNTGAYKHVANPGFSIGHLENQLPYLKWKRSILKEFSNPIKLPRPGGICSFAMKNCLREDWYKQLFYEQKVLGPENCALKPQDMNLSELVRDKIDLLGVAIWIMDDGTKANREIRVKANSYKNQDFRGFLASINSRLGLSLAPSKARKNAPRSKLDPATEPWYGFKVDSHSMSKLAPYFHKMFKAQIVAAYGKEIGSKVGTWQPAESDLKPNGPVSHSATVVEIISSQSDVSRKLGRGTLTFYEEDRYDIQVKGNATYCVDRVFVHNSPLYEPCGEALKYMSDIRIHYNPRALSGVPFNPKGKGQIEEEPSITGDGVDVYRYINAKAIKNKLSIPGRDTWLRIWVSDVDQVAHGFDPVWDTFYAMSLTGQVEGKRHAMKLNVHGQGEAKKSLNWEEFKTLILGNKDQVTEICSKIGYKPMNLRKGMFNLFKKGILEDLYIAHKKSNSGAKKSDDEEETSDED